LGAIDRENTFTAQEVGDDEQETETERREEKEAEN